MLALLLSLTLAHAEPYPMADAGVTVNLPRGWTMSRWSDWDFEGKSPDGAMLFKIWLTPYQVDVTDAAAAAWAEADIAAAATEGINDAKLVSSSVETVGGRQVARIKLGFKLDGGLSGVIHSLAFTSAGQVVHARILTAAKNDPRALGALNEILSAMTMEKTPLPTTGAEVSTSAGFAATLPEGWRAPLTEELVEVTPLTASLGRDEIKPEECWVAIRPPPTGKADIMLACVGSLFLGPIDDYSFEGEEPLVRAKFFSKIKEEIPAAEKAEVGDRMGFYYRPGDGTHPVRMATAPYGASRLMVLWGVGNQLDGPGLDAAMMATLKSTRFSGDDGGKPQFGIDQRISYFLSYRPTSPVVIGPVVGLLAAIGLIIRRRRRQSAVS